MTVRRSTFAMSLGLLLASADGGGAQEVRFEVAGGGGERLVLALRAASLLLTLEDEEAPAPQDYVAAARADYRRLLTALYAEGHYGGAVSIEIDGREASAIAPLAAPGEIDTVTVAVAPGPLFSFGRATVAPVPPGTELPESFATGAPARSGAIREAVRTGVGAWRDLGYAKAEPGAQQITAVHPENRLDAAVVLEPGPRLTFGPLAISGNIRVRTDRIAEIAALPQGRVFSPEEVARAEDRLRRTGAFASVALSEAEAPLPDQSLPFELAVIELPPRRLGFGAEVSSLEGVTLSGFWLHRNLLGGAERLRVETEVAGLAGETGGTDYRVAAQFGRPATFGANTELTVAAAVQRLDEPGYLLDRADVEVGLTRRLRNGITLTFGAGLLTAREVNDFRTREYTLLTLPWTGELDRRDDPLDATEGFFLSLEATPFVGLRGGADGARLYGDGRIYRSFGDRVTLAARGQVGSVLGAELADAPADFRFYSGGGGTVRGQGYRSLGVSTARIFGVPGRPDVGGLSFAGGQFEARVGITEKIGAVGFYDIGYVSPEPSPWDEGNWHAGAGLGLRYATGIGPIRLDLATPVGTDDAFESVQIYLGIGQSF